MMNWNREAALLGIPDLPGEAFLHVGDRKIKPQGGGGSGGGGGTTTATSYTTNVPEYAREAFMQNIGQAQALTNKPYQAYEGERVAGFNPMQQQAFQNIGGQQVSPQTEVASGLSAEAAMRGLGASQYAPLEAQNQFQAPGAYQSGQFYGGQFGGREAARYMSPYIEQALAPQMREAARNAQIAGQQQQAQAVGRGAFGGSREALMRTENARNLGQQQSDILSKGYQTAYEQAATQYNQDAARRMQAQQLGEQSRQFGATQGLNAAQLQAQYGQSAQQLAEQSRQYGAGLGLQGLQTALQGAGQLGNLGQQQFAQEQGISQAQLAAGSQQQQLEQQRMSQQYQDFLNQVNYPYQQIGFMSDLLRGTGSSTRSVYPGPTPMQTIGSLGMGAYGLGQIASSGKLFAEGGSVDAPHNIEAIVNKLSDAQLKQAAQAAQTRGDVQELQIIQQELAMRASERGGIAGAFNQLPQEQQQTLMAGGGIVAFAGGGTSDDEDGEDDLASQFAGMAPTTGNPAAYAALTNLFPTLLANVAKAKYTPMTEEQYSETIKKRRAMLEEAAGPSPYEGIKTRMTEMRGEGEKDLQAGRGLAALQAAGSMMQGRGFMQGLGQAGNTFATSYGQAMQADTAQKRALMNMEINLADAQRKERIGLNREAISAADQARKDHDAAQMFGIKKAQALANVAGKFAGATKPIRPAGAGAGSAKEFIVGPAAYAGQLQAEHPDWSPTKIRAESFKMYQQQKSAGLPGAQLAATGRESAQEIQLGNAITEAQEKAKIHPDYIKADAAGKQRILDDTAARVRANASKAQPQGSNLFGFGGTGVNQNSPQAGSPVLKFDAKGNLLP